MFNWLLREVLLLLVAVDLHVLSFLLLSVFYVLKCVAGCTYVDGDIVFLINLRPVMFFDLESN